ncbi:MAG: hypothetical protein RL071_4483 [Pseudomonadota bacterium]
MPVLVLPWALALLSCTLATTYTPELGSSGLAWDAEDSGGWVEVGVPVDPGAGDGGADTGAPATTVTAIPAGGTVACASGDPAQPVSLSVENNLGYDVDVLAIDGGCVETSQGLSVLGVPLVFTTQVGASLILRAAIDRTPLYAIRVGVGGGAVVVP